MNAHRLGRVPAALLYPCLLATAALPAALAQSTSSASDQPAYTATAAPTSPSNSKEETVMLSPFEVVEDSKGYYSANSMSGTRFNSNLQDLGSAITVMSTEQMKDFGMLDINDIFLYTVGTEGTGTFSDFAINQNGELTDNVSLNPTQANRVRGIASANVSYGNFETMGRMPIDPTIISGIEISRGPNANVFGLGNPSGTVNQVAMTANPTKDKTKVEFRTDSYGGWRSSLDFNKVILKNKIALRTSLLRQHDEFMRRPTGMETKRYNFALKLQPWKNTSVNAVYLNYKQYGNRPNFTPPRNYVSHWIEKGKPGWDPISQKIVMPNGTTYGPYTKAADVLASPMGSAFNNSGGMFQRSNVYIDRDGIFYWSTPNNNTGSTPLANTGSGTTLNADGTVRSLGWMGLLGSSPGPNGNSGKYTDQPLFSTVRSVTSKELYDYESINLAAPNYTWETDQLMMVTLDQFFINTPMHMLAFQGGYMREKANRYREVPIGDAGTGGQNGQLWVDVNTRNLDGSINANFGRPFIGVNEPQFQYSPATWQTYRAQLAYRLDMTKAKGWAKWLGNHHFSPYYEYKYRVERKYSYRDAMSSTHAWLAEGQPGVKVNFARANNAAITGGPQDGPAIARPFFRWYVGDNQGTNVDYAPGPITRGPQPFQWGTYGNWKVEQAELATLATTSGTGGSNNLRRIMKTEGAVMQNTWLQGLLTTTFGVREDEVFAKQGLQLQLLTDNNTAHDYAQIDKWEEKTRYSKGRTQTAQYVTRPFAKVGFAKKWASEGAGITKFLGELITGTVLSYNKSNNFIPSPPAIDLFRNPLPDQTGEGKDLGLWLNLFDNKLVVRYNHYQNSQLNARTGNANTVAARILRLDGIYANDRQGLFFRATDWWTLTNPDWSQAEVETKIYEQMQISKEEYTTLNEAANSGALAATNDIIAKGDEIEINVNPVRHWTVSFNAEKKQSMDKNLSNAVQQWMDRRLPVWTKIVDQNYDPLLTDGTKEGTGWLPTATEPDHLWWSHSYNGSTAKSYYTDSVESLWYVVKANEGKSRPQIRKYTARFSTRYGLAGLTSNRYLRNITVGGALRWEDKSAIGYYGVETYPAKITKLDPSRPIYDQSHTYVDAWIEYRTKLFKDKVSASFRLNARNLQEGGRLQPVGAFPNGEIHSYRIVDPRQFILSANFEL